MNDLNEKRIIENILMHDLLFEVTIVCVVHGTVTFDRGKSARLVYIEKITGKNFELLDRGELQFYNIHYI